MPLSGVSAAPTKTVVDEHPSILAAADPPCRPNILRFADSHGSLRGSCGLELESLRR